MRDSPDPAVHRRCQQQFVAHAQRLLEDERFAVDTTAGLKPVTAMVRNVVPGDDAVGVKRKMVELGLFDRGLQRAMPPGQTLDVTLYQRTFFGGQQPAGRVRVVCASPTEPLLKGEAPGPLDAAAVQKVLSAQPPSLGGLPQTVILVSTSGLTDDARRLAERRRGGAVVLAEVNDAGGWTVTAPPGLEGLGPLLDPETDEQKRRRVVADVEASADLLTGGVSADRVAERLRVPRPLVEAALREYAERHPGLAADTFEGTLVVYREGTPGLGDPTGDDAMPFWEKVKGMFGRGEEPREKRVARLSQEKAVLAHQRDRAYAEVELVEKKEAELTAAFPAATPLAQKRIATEISQLRKRVERIQQLVSTIDKKINIVETGVHNLEMEHHLSKEKLAALEDVAKASEEVDVGMATLDQLNEQADAVSVVGAEMSMGASDVLAELQAKFADKPEAGSEKSTSAGEKAAPQRDRTAVGATAGPPPIPAERRKVPGAAEPG